MLLLTLEEPKAVALNVISFCKVSMGSESEQGFVYFRLWRSQTCLLL